MKNNCNPSYEIRFFKLITKPFRFSIKLNLGFLIKNCLFMWALNLIIRNYNISTSKTRFFFS